MIIDKTIEKQIIDDVWSGNIDQMNTTEIAEGYGIGVRDARRLLMKIAEGKISSYPFVYDADRLGVRVSNGRLFTHSSMDVDGTTMSNNRRSKHYIWFVS